MECWEKGSSTAGNIAQVGPSPTALVGVASEDGEERGGEMGPSRRVRDGRVVEKGEVVIREVKERSSQSTTGANVSNYQSQPVYNRGNSTSISEKLINTENLETLATEDIEMSVTKLNTLLISERKSIG